MTIALAAVGAALATLLVTLLVQWSSGAASQSRRAELTEAVRELEVADGRGWFGS